MELSLAHPFFRGLFGIPGKRKFLINSSRFYHDTAPESRMNFKFSRLFNGVWNLILHTEFTLASHDGILLYIIENSSYIIILSRSNRKSADIVLIFQILNPLDDAGLWRCLAEPERLFSLFRWTFRRIHSPVYSGKDGPGDVMPDREYRAGNCCHGQIGERA